MLAVFLLMNGFFLPMAKVNAMRGSEGRKLFQERKKKQNPLAPVSRLISVKNYRDYLFTLSTIARATQCRIDINNDNSIVSINQTPRCVILLLQKQSLLLCVWLPAVESVEPSYFSTSLCFCQ